MPDDDDITAPAPPPHGGTHEPQPATPQAPDDAPEEAPDAADAIDAGEAAEPGAPAAVPMSPADCAQRLAALFPALFAGAPKPLKLRVHADIQARAPGVFSRSVLSAFMRRHTGSTAYLNAVARGTQRFGLDGEPAGEIAPEHRQAAIDELARRRARFAGQREREAEQRARDEHERRARAALLRDFERTTLTAANFCALKGLTPDALEAQLALARREATERPVHLQPARHARREDAHATAPPRRPGGDAPKRADRTGQPPRRPRPPR